jgi:PAS domain S-box-containing protein
MSNTDSTLSLSPDWTPTAPATVESQISRLAGILDALPDSILCIDRSWHMVYANAEAIRLSRLRPELFASLDFWQTYPHLIGSEMERRYRAAMASVKDDHFEFYYEPFDVWVDIHVMPTDEGLALCYRDISERKRAERGEAEAADQVRLAFEAIPDGVVIIDSEWRFTFANQRSLEILGHTDILGKNIFELFPGNAREPFDSSYRHTMATRQPSEFEAFNGEPLNTWFRVQAKPYTQGDDEGIIVFFSDVSQRKQSELREQEAARRLAQVLEVTSDAVVSLDRQWRFTYLNTHARRLIDPNDRLLGKNIWDEFPLAVGGPAWEIYHRSMNEGVAGHVEAYSQPPVDAWLSITSQPTPDGIVVFFRDITEQRNHDEIVRAQQELLETVQSVGRIATFAFSLDTGAITWGPAAFGIYGRPPETVTSFADVREFLVEGQEQNLLEVMERCRTSGTMMHIEYAVTAPDGSVIWIEGRGQSQANADGSVVVRGVAIDVTQRHLDQQELIASEARYRVLADLNPQAIWMGDAEGNITYANQGFMAYIGLQPSDLGGGGWLNAFAPEEQERVREVWGHCVATGEDYDIEGLIRDSANGEYRYWHLRAAPVRDASGAILHWLGVGQDVHDTKTYTAALRAEQMETERRRAELETIYTTTPVGLALLDPVNLTFLNLNEYEAQMLGAPREQLLGKPLAEIAPPDNIPQVFELMRTAASGTPVRNQLLEGELTPRPGERRYWSVNYSPILNEDGSVRAISTASIEITNQKRAEAALIQSEKLAAVGRLASSISHEINNPLEAITNLLYLISLDDKLPDELRVYVHMAQSELSRVSQIATQTLRFHRQAVAPTAVTPAELVNAVVRLYTGRLANSSIKVDARYLTETRILCFENDIRQVLNNLIANAIDAMRRGGRLIIRAHEAHLRGTADDPQASRPGVRITIADTGHGMSQNTMRRIFEPFFTTKDLNGTGLGLWISAGIIERHQGSIRVRSSDRAGQSGTVFTLFLPREEHPSTHA